MAVEIANIISGGTLGTLVVGREVKVVKYLVVETDNTVDAADTFVVDLADYAGTTFLALDGYKHTTDNSVIVAEDNTTAVSGTEITVTIIAGTDDDKRVCKIYFF